MTVFEMVAQAPDLIEPLIGYRHWSVRDDRLHSPFRGDRWDDVELHACCQQGSHDPVDVPAGDCDCGIYAYYDRPPRSSAATRDLVIGAVVLWGQIELHGGGMRAASARLVGLALPPVSGRKRRRLVAAAAYLEVPAVPFGQLGQLAGRHGAPLPAGLRPPRTPLPWDCPFGLARTSGRLSAHRSADLNKHV